MRAPLCRCAEGLCDSAFELTTWRKAGCPKDSALPALQLGSAGPQVYDVALYLASSSTSCMQVLANNTDCFATFMDAHRDQLGCFVRGHCPVSINVVESVIDSICPEMTWIRYGFGLRAAESA